MAQLLTKMTSVQQALHVFNVIKAIFKRHFKTLLFACLKVQIFMRYSDNFCVTSNQILGLKILI